MLSPRKFATLMLLRDVEVLLERLVTFETLTTGEHRPLVTASGPMILKAAARIREAGYRAS